jgi:hypothetical protein
MTTLDICEVILYRLPWVAISVGLFISAYDLYKHQKAHPPTPEQVRKANQDLKDLLKIGAVLFLVAVWLRRRWSRNYYGRHQWD